MGYLTDPLDPFLLIARLEIMGQDHSRLERRTFVVPRKVPIESLDSQESPTSYKFAGCI